MKFFRNSYFITLFLLYIVQHYLSASFVCFFINIDSIFEALRITYTITKDDDNNIIINFDVEDCLYEYQKYLPFIIYFSNKVVMQHRPSDTYGYAFMHNTWFYDNALNIAIKMPGRKKKNFCGYYILESVRNSYWGDLLHISIECIYDKYQYTTLKEIEILVIYIR